MKVDLEKILDKKMFDQYKIIDNCSKELLGLVSINAEEIECLCTDLPYMSIYQTWVFFKECNIDEIEDLILDKEYDLTAKYLYSNRKYQAIEDHIIKIFIAGKEIKPNEITVF